MYFIFQIKFILKIKDLLYKVIPSLKKDDKDSSNFDDVVKVEPVVEDNKEQKETNKDTHKEVEKSVSENDSFSLRLSANRKEHVAKKIIEESDVWTLYWIQLIISCMLATLWLLANSIPVIIWSMLVSPILAPIQSFAFAVICGKKHLYAKSLKILFLSILVAIPSSFLICYFIPFASVTEQVLLRWTPTVLDLVVALLSWLIAFLFLWYEKLEDSIVWIAIAVSLMPPLAAVWIGLHFANYSVAQGSFLLFITNLVWILAMWILVLYIFGFKPTNNTWKARTWVTLLMVMIFVWLITVPLWQSMSQIAQDQKTTSVISKVSDTYLSTLNDNVVISELAFRSVSNDIIRVSEKLDVPSDFTLTNVHKDELTKRLSESLWKSVELDLDIVELSSVYIDDTNITEKSLVQDVSNYLEKNDILLVDYKILQEDITYFFFDVYVNSKVNKNDIYDELNSKVSDKYWTGIKIVLQRQTNPELSRVEKTQAEVDLEKQFYLLFPDGVLNKLSVDYSQQLQNEDEYVESAEIYIDFDSPYTTYKTKDILSKWKQAIEKYLDVNVNIKTKFQVFSIYEQ